MSLKCSHALSFEDMMEIPKCELCEAEFKPGGLSPVCNLCWNKMAAERDSLRLQVREYEGLLQRAESWLHGCAPLHYRAPEIRELADTIHETWERYRKARFDAEKRNHETKEKS